MPNHYTTMAICTPGYDFNVEDFNAKHAKSDLCAIVKPMPELVEQVGIKHTPAGDVRFNQTTLEPVEGSIDWYNWANDNWGTKWGTYDVQAFALGGDDSPIIIKFQSAWNAPKILDKIASWICKTYKFTRIAFVGFNPYDESTKILETFQCEPQD